MLSKDRSHFNLMGVGFSVRALALPALEFLVSERCARAIGIVGAKTAAAE